MPTPASGGSNNVGSTPSGTGSAFGAQAPVQPGSNPNYDPPPTTPGVQGSATEAEGGGPRAFHGRDVNGVMNQDAQMIEHRRQRMKVGIIIGVVCLGIFLLFIIGIVVVFVCVRKSHDEKSKEMRSEYEERKNRW